MMILLKISIFFVIVSVGLGMALIYDNLTN